MDDSTDLRAKRRRQTWQATVTRTGEHAPVGLLVSENGLEIMWEIASTAWILSGRAMPTYSRAEMPGRLHVEDR